MNKEVKGEMKKKKKKRGIIIEGKVGDGERKEEGDKERGE